MHAAGTTHRKSVSEARTCDFHRGSCMRRLSTQVEKGERWTLDRPLYPRIVIAQRDGREGKALRGESGYSEHEKISM